MSITLITVLLAAAAMLGLALVMAFVLGWANRAFHVPVDPRVEKINEVLPGANCGACGYIGCGEYAEALTDPEVEVTLCPVGGQACAMAIADILGRETGKNWPMRAVVHCSAGYDKRLQRRAYTGDATCQAANMVSGVQGCTFGCLGFGDCERSCPFDAIHVINGLATVDYEKCVGCSKCAAVCPRNIISMVPFKADRILAVTCCNQDFGKEVTSVCLVGCIGCKMCTKQHEIIEMEGNVPTINYNAYEPGSDFTTVIDKCPRESMVWLGKPTPEDVAAAEDMPSPGVATADFKTTVDNADWRG